MTWAQRKIDGNKSIVSQVKSSDVNSSSSSEIAKLTHVCLAADGNIFPEYRDNIQGYVSAVAVNYNQDTSYQAPIQQNQVVHLSELEKIKKINDVNLKAMQDQINNVKNELRNEMTSIQASMSNQTNELKNMMASFFQMNTASTSGSGSLPSNTVANPRDKLKAITTRSGLVLDGPSVLMPPLFINPEEDERVEETLTNPKLVEYMETDIREKDEKSSKNGQNRARNEKCVEKSKSKSTLKSQQSKLRPKPKKHLIGPPAPI
ncbi:hypothetical protein Tco_0502860 [Tanacetum coccineum]